MKSPVLIFLLLLALLPRIALAADTLGNLAPQAPAMSSPYMPGAILLMPDGSQAVVMEQLDNGDLLTDLEIIVSPEGVIRTGEDAGKKAEPDPAFTAAVLKGETASIEPPMTAPKPDQAGKAPGKGFVNPAIDTPKTPIVAAPVPEKTVNTVAPAKNPEDLSGKTEAQLTLAQLLPMTNIATGKMQEARPVQEKSAAEKPAAKAAPNNVKQRPEAKKQTPEKKENSAQTKKQQQKAPAAKSPAKAKAGEELRIPQEAIKSGNLEFLEGCWQGTRPEYYSKRTIRECFCFGSSGKSGKRRIYDHGRMCIGGTRASLSGNGVLSVTSSGAACNDGERWGSAEMVCRNSGPKTPCSWVFRDANNGSQSYTIPFVRVDSCGR